MRIGNAIPAALKTPVRDLLRRVARRLSDDSSQHGETILLQTLAAQYVRERFLIDVGAHDGVTISNSLPFVVEGWRALLIEPAPAVFAKLVAAHGHRPNVTCLQVACSSLDGEADLYFGSDGPEGFMSTLCTDDNAWFRTNRGSASVRVRTATLTGLLAAHGCPAHPGILMVDCEGMDYEVLLGLDLARFRPAVIVTEEYESNAEKHAAKYALLIRGGYSLVQKIGCNTVWRDHTVPARTPGR